MTALHDAIPDPEHVLALEPEEFAGTVLKLLVEAENGPQATLLNRYNFLLRGRVADYPHEHQPAIQRALAEAWVWLEREGLLAPDPNQHDGWVFVTRRGRRLAAGENFAAYHAASLLPKGVLHPVIAQRVWATFLRGAYDTAVFEAFRQVEIAVRRAGGFTDHDHGQTLMHAAFDKARGPLADRSLPDAEQHGLQLLFAGAVQWFRNPVGHRNVEYDAVEAMEVIVFASHLLRLIDRAEARLRPGATRS